MEMRVMEDGRWMRDEGQSDGVTKVVGYGIRNME